MIMRGVHRGGEQLVEALFRQGPRGFVEQGEF
jgi:hypothetical protein